MSTRRAANANRIRGPQSALTDFLAAHNISAQQIHTDYQRRLQDAQQQQGQDEAGENEDKENEVEDDEEEDLAERKKRKRKEEKALMKIKQSKEFKRQKYERKRKGGDDESEDDDVLAKSMMAKSQPLPGQLENCEVCEKRFTVTPYSRTGPGGGLLCTKCSKELKDEEKKTQAQERKAKQRAPAKGRKRQTESDRLMGNVKPGAKSLIEQCVNRVADVAHDIEEFGDLPANLLERLSQIFSRKRVMTSRTMELFLRPDLNWISIYDCGKLETDDFIKIFNFMPDVENVNLRFAGQMKDDALNYMKNKNKWLKNLQLGATNLISDTAWVEYFEEHGHALESLKLSELNDSLHDETVAVMVEHCKNLKRLKLRSCSHMSDQSIVSISSLANLQHLSLAIASEAPSEVLVNLITAVGPNLLTLSLENFQEADDALLEAIKHNCTRLSKLRVTGSSYCTDQAFANLFTKWSNPPMTYIDLSDNRDIDNANPDGPQDNPTGFGSKGLKAIMKHSGSHLERLNLHSCRHISQKALMDVFDGKRRYPLLKDIDFSFVTFVNDVVMTGIFRSCSNLTKLAVFACFNARGVRIPAGIAVVGLPNAQDNVVVEGGVLGES